MNILPAQLTSAGYRLTVQVEDGPPLRIPSTRAPRYAAHAGKRVLLGLRPEHLTDQRPEHGSTPAILRAPVQFVEPMGMETLVHINIGGSEAIARCRPDVRIRAGETITLVADMDHAHVIDPATDLVL
jgi:multiple sugar transport system ATP-binding protein